MASLATALNPNWEEFDRKQKAVHDWRSYVNEETRKLWDRLTLETRIILISNLQEVADQEHWD